MTTLHWLRRDLRLADNPALTAAGSGAVLVFCLDERLVAGRHASPRRNAFLRAALTALAAEVGDRGGRLVVLRGRPHEQVPALARRLGATAVHAHDDVSPYARARDARVAAALRTLGVPLHRHPGLWAVDDLTALRRKDGAPVTVFTPFHRQWLTAPRRPVLPAPTVLAPVPDDVGDPSALTALGDASAGDWPAGEAGAHLQLDRFLDEWAGGYDRRHDQLEPVATSGLSPYLHLGLLSPRQVEERLDGGRAHTAFHRQLAWRDFYAAVLLHFPGNATRAFNPARRDLPWPGGDEEFAAWAQGRTGYPIVDAAMRQLAAEGWLPNRARLIVGSFLVKHLGVDWRRGEEYFMHHLVDGDMASNNGNWQWIASVGVDPAPVARRLYNPSLQQERHDPAGRYVRRWCPELARVPLQHLARPWEMPPLLQVEAGCVIGEDYPAPVVDHAEARRAALDRYTATSSAG